LLFALFALPKTIQAQWHATVGAQSKDQGHQALAFLPNEIWIHAGDNITWTFEADEIHTLTFLKPGQVRPPFGAGCPGISPNNSSFDGSTCVTTDALVKGQTFTITFPTAGNFKFVCLVHENMTGVIHVLDLSQPLPHDQAFYGDQAADERNDLLSDTDHDKDHGEHDSDHHHSAANGVTTGIGEVVATGGGSQTLSILRFLEPTKVIHAGETVEWTNEDPITPHTITFGAIPANPFPPSSNVTVDADGAEHATINSTTDSANSGIIVAAFQDRAGLAQTPAGVTRFRVTFTHAGTFPYMCLLHGSLGMKGKVIVLP
jgi:plastocyanin